jgi:hypothetical protein
MMTLDCYTLVIKMNFVFSQYMQEKLYVLRSSKKELIEFAIINSWFCCILETNLLEPLAIFEERGQI